MFVIEDPKNQPAIVARLDNAIREEQKLRRIMDDMSDGFFVVGFDWSYIYVNRSGAEMCRLTPQKMTGKTVRQLFADIESSEFYRDMKACMENRAAKRCETRFVHGDLSVNWYEVQLQPVEDGISMLVSDITVRRYREDQLNRTKDLLLQRIEWRTSQLENSNNDLRDSIVYAQQIQNAFLPPLTDLERSFPDSFIFHQPKDLVSGDFFWTWSHRSKTVVAVADCTGHGVPGALLSIIGAQSLLDAVNISLEPSVILYELNMRMKRALRQSDDDCSSRDGMDICLCVIDHAESTIHFSGANRSLYVKRRNSAELDEIKGTRTAIAGFTENGSEFAAQTLDICSGDCIYLTSDGFADQDGGPNGKKLKTRGFKEQLLKTSDYSMSEQGKRLQSFFHAWKGERPQMDDVMVAGIRI
jgi:PAS domain S-box-containing protein